MLSRKPIITESERWLSEHNAVRFRSRDRQATKPLIKEAVESSFWCQVKAVTRPHPPKARQSVSAADGSAEGNVKKRPYVMLEEGNAIDVIHRSVVRLGRENDKAPQPRQVGAFFYLGDCVGVNGVPVLGSFAGTCPTGVRWSSKPRHQSRGPRFSGAGFCAKGYRTYVSNSHQSNPIEFLLTIDPDDFSLGRADHATG